MSIATAEFQCVATRDVIECVQTIDETRRQRLNMLIQKHGSIAALNAAIGLARTDATLSQIRNKSPHSKTKTPRVMGDPMARKIEQELNLPQGWMDTPPTYNEMLGEDDPRTKVLLLMESLPSHQWPTAVRLLDALAQPPSTGTNGHN